MEKSQLLFWFVIAVCFGWFIHLISPILLPFLVGIGMAYLLDPLVDRVEARGCSRTMSTLIVSGSIFTLTILTLFAVIPLLLDQLASFLAALPGYIAYLRQLAEGYLMQWGETFHIVRAKEGVQDIAASLATDATSVISNVMTGLLKSGIAVVNFAALIIITPVVTFYLLRDWDKIVADIDGLLPRRYAPVIRVQLAEIDRTLSAFLRGQLNVMLCLFLFYALALSLAGLHYSLIIALVGGVMVIIPYIGTVVSGALAVGMAYIQFGTIEHAGLILAIFAAGQVLEGYVLTPKLVGSLVGLNPLWIIFGMMAGGSIMGFVGMLLAVPITAICGVLIRFAVSEYLGSRFYGAHSGEGERTPDGTPASQ
ncbi:MAG: AI-2E family transporter [Sphaerospermopsis sp. SIO1G2]|nr:AI-2E family transporter [Sphaerospermopsis sp. SIO1G2]